MKFAIGLVILMVAYTTKTKAQINDDTRIVGGDEALISAHPHQVSLRKRNLDTPNKAFSHTCGGSIYDRNFIVTAAHCTVSKLASQLLVVAGSTYITGVSGVIVPVREIIVHEMYNNNYLENDVSLLVLGTPLPLNNHTIKAIKLTDKEYAAGMNAKVSGWGRLKFGNTQPLPSHLMDVTVPLVSREVCRNAYGDSIDASMICAGSLEGGHSVCQGDSGGPLVANGSLIGIVSWGSGCAYPSYPAVYANVNHLRPWILEKIADARARYNLN